jgi:hypothetical protein
MTPPHRQGGPEQGQLELTTQVNDRNAVISDHATGEPLPLAQDAEQEVLARNLAVAQPERLAQRQFECLLGSGAEGYVPPIARWGPIASPPSSPPPRMPVRRGRRLVREVSAGGSEDDIEVDADRRQRAAVRVSSGTLARRQVGLDRVSGDAVASKRRGRCAATVHDGTKDVLGTDGPVAEAARVPLRVDDRRAGVISEPFEHRQL